MSTIFDAPAAAQGTTGHSWTGQLAAALKRWWVARLLTPRERSISPRHLGWRWCDSTERDLTDELLGRRGWHNSKLF